MSVAYCSSIFSILGAAHDAQNIPVIGPMGMIFVPSLNGISHHCTVSFKVIFGDHLISSVSFSNTFVTVFNL